MLLSSLHPSEIDPFCRWALGTTYEGGINLSQAMTYWNLYHGDIFMLSPDGNVVRDTEKMISIWREKTQMSICYKS